MQIKIIDPIYSVADIQDIHALKTVLFFQKTFWKQGPFRKESVIKDVSLISKSGKFLTGYIPRIKNFCKQRNIPLSIECPNQTFSSIPPSLPGIKFKDIQKEAISKGIMNFRGIINLPTGVGKTITAAGIISSFPDFTIMFIVQAKGLLHQTHKTFSDFFQGDLGDQIGIIGDGVFNPKRITIATIQSLHKRILTNFPFDKINMVFVDEAHHVSGFTGTYAEVLKRMTNAWYRLGLTATISNKPEAAMAMEGYLGPVIYTKGVSEMIKSGNLSTPKLKIIKLPKNPHVNKLRNYKEVYEWGIIHNRTRARRVFEEAQKFVDDQKTVLILVTRIEHGTQLQETANNLFPHLQTQFVSGDSEIETRIKVKKGLDSGKVKVAIATTIFKEGEDIPNLGAIINASGGKSELAIIQSLGRGLRITETKKEVFFIDFFDESNYYLVNHFGHRISLYFDLNWL